MASKEDSSERRLVPRWRYARRIVHTAEHSGDPRARPTFVSRLAIPQDVIENWRRRQSITTAADLVANAVAFDKPAVAHDAARFLIVNKSRTTRDVASLARSVLPDPAATVTNAHTLPIGSESGQEARRIVHDTRLRLADSPRNVAYRLDLSLAYTVLGHAEKAWIEMNRARILAPNHRNVLRATVRLLIHLNRAEEAYALVRRHPRTLQDPWLMSLELTLASILSQPVKLALRARKLIEELKHEPAFIAELTSATGMLELHAGNHKRGRKLLQLSLVDPTDNVIAQAQWAKQQDKSIIVLDKVLQRPGTMEANFFHAMAEARWADALTHVNAWEIDEPFSSRPAVSGSFLALSLLDDSERAIQFAEAGLRADGGDQLLRNNYVVALTRASRIKDAQAEFQKIQRPLPSSYPEYSFLATKGLLAFADGEIEVGRKLYTQAIELARHTERQLVLVNWMDTESRYSPETAELMIKEYGALLQSNRNPVISAMATETIKHHKKQQLTISIERPKKLGVPPVLLQLLKYDRTVKNR